MIPGNRGHAREIEGFTGRTISEGNLVNQDSSPAAITDVRKAEGAKLRFKDLYICANIDIKIELSDVKMELSDFDEPVDRKS